MSGTGTSEGADCIISHQMLLDTSGEFDTESIQCLNLQNRGISNIDGLSECKNILRLNLSCNKISLLNSIKDLTQLTFLNLSSNRITSIEPLRFLEALEDLNLAGNMLGSADRLRCLCNIAKLQKLRLCNAGNKLSNPLCKQENYHNTVLSILPQLLTLDGSRVRGRGSELYKMCCDLDKQLESGRTFGPVPERPLPEPWIKPGFFVRGEDKISNKNTLEFEKILNECKALDAAVESKLALYKPA